MNRRGFLRGLFGVGAVAAFDPHRVIFDMGRKLFLRDPTIIAADFGFSLPPGAVVTHIDGMIGFDKALRDIYLPAIKAQLNARSGLWQYLKLGEFKTGGMTVETYGRTQASAGSGLPSPMSTEWPDISHLDFDDPDEDD